ncbi:MAG TPA: NAD(P)H-dependent oxidoreductase [Burkholderiales bacterium]|nr:NAD(P)H-dependent oxidoreductase [Burkholderiales bacterium]
MSKILAIAGSTRGESLNRKLLAVAAQAVLASGADVTVLDLREYPMPIYEGDLEAREGIPANARKLKAIFREHQGLLIASPEYNASVSPLLKNTLDWVSRQDGGQNGLVPYQGKVAALFAASQGVYGGLRGLMHIRAILQNLGVLVLNEQYALGRAHEAFTAEAKLNDPRAQASVDGIAQRLVQVIEKLN